MIGMIDMSEFYSPIDKQNATFFDLIPISPHFSAILIRGVIKISKTTYVCHCKCEVNTALVIVLGRVGLENIWPSAMSSRKIFSRLDFPLSQ